MAKRKALPDAAAKTAQRIKMHNCELQDLAARVADNPADRKSVMRLLVVAGIIGDNIDQLLNPDGGEDGTQTVSKP